MGKVSPRQSRTAKQKRRGGRNSSKYLKPGALAQLRYTKASSAVKSLCTHLVKKSQRNDDGDDDDALLLQNRIIVDSSSPTPTMLSPVRFDQLRSPMNNLQRTPKTPRASTPCQSDSKLESLPMDVLVKILCHLHHDELKAVFHVSQRIRKAVIQARQFHFNYTTPDRTRQEMLRVMTPLPTNQWPFMSKGDGKGFHIPSPNTPKAPRHGPRPPSRLKLSEMRQIAAVLFQEPAFPSKYLVPSVLSKPLCKSLASNRVLFYEDELCQAVAQNKLL